MKDRKAYQAAYYREHAEQRKTYMADYYAKHATSREQRKREVQALINEALRVEVLRERRVLNEANDE